MGGKKNKKRKSEEWGKILHLPDDSDDGEVEVQWDGGRKGTTTCKIMDYCRPKMFNLIGGPYFFKPMRLRKLIIEDNLKKGNWVRAAEGKKRLFGKSRGEGEWGEITQDIPQWGVGRH